MKFSYDIRNKIKGVTMENEKAIKEQLEILKTKNDPKFNLTKAFMAGFGIFDFFKVSEEGDNNSEEYQDSKVLEVKNE